MVAAADFGNGISWVLPRREGYTFLNPDLTVYPQRTPEGEWICLEAESTVQPHGVAMAESRLWDVRGPLGRSVQSLLIEEGLAYETTTEIKVVQVAFVRHTRMRRNLKCRAALAREGE